MVNYLLVGGGFASATAAETLRREGAQGSIMMLCAENELPYRRIRLSKQYLLGEMEPSELLLHPAKFYDDLGIEMMLNTEVCLVNSKERYVQTRAGSIIYYGKLLLATGARSKDFEGENGALEGIYKIRTKLDCELIREAALKSKSAVVCGGDFKGLEVVMSLAKMGIKASLVEMEKRVLPYIESDVISDYFASYAEQNGVTLRLNETITAFEGKDKVEGVVLQSGEVIPCDMAILCMGNEPNSAYLEGSGVELKDKRIFIDDQMRTNIPEIFAAGDVVDFYDPIFRRRRHIEHWDNARRQGRVAALNMLEKRVRYDEVSYFFCEVGDLSFSMLGDPTDTKDRVERGTLDSHNYAQFYLRNNALKSVFAMGQQPRDIRHLEHLIRYHVNLRAHKEELKNPKADFSRLAMQNVLILQGGGALGAFECGVVRALEENNIFPDIVAGISIGALNGGIIASHPNKAAQVLKAFWSELTVESPKIGYEPFRRMIASANILQFGVPNFFTPNWFPAFDEKSQNDWMQPWTWTGLYDTAPMRRLIQKYVDFKALKRSPVRLLVGAVNVLNGELDIFDSYADDLTPDHLLASGSLPPGFSWTYVNGKPYWDGGVVSNSPLDLVLDRCGEDGKKVYMIDLYAGERPLPKNIMEVMTRRDEIVYCERVKSDLKLQELKDSYRFLISMLMNELEPVQREKIMQRPQYIQLMGDGSELEIIRIVRRAIEGELSSRDYDFSDLAIAENQERGYEIALDVLRHKG